MRLTERPFNVGQPIITKDGRAGQVLYFDYAKDGAGQATITGAVVLFGRTAELLPIGQLKAETGQNEGQLPLAGILPDVQDAPGIGENAGEWLVTSW